MIFEQFPGSKANFCSESWAVQILICRPAIFEQFPGSKANFCSESWAVQILIYRPM